VDLKRAASCDGYQKPAYDVTLTKISLAPFTKSRCYAYAVTLTKIHLAAYQWQCITLPAIYWWSVIQCKDPFLIFNPISYQLRMNILTIRVALAASSVVLAARVSATPQVQLGNVTLVGRGVEGLQQEFFGGQFTSSSF
jgi:hypothetical protein